MDDERTTPSLRGRRSRLRYTLLPLGEFVKQQFGSWGTRIKEAGIEPE